MLDCCQFLKKKKEKEKVDANATILFKDAIMTRHLQPRKNVSIVRGREASNRAEI